MIHVEHYTFRGLVLPQAKVNKFCKKRDCNHLKCSKTYSQNESIAASENKLFKKKFGQDKKIKKWKRVYLNRCKRAT
jgi:hypothetical protein